MEIWVVEHGDKYEGAYGHKYFTREKSALAYARKEHDIKEFTMRGKTYMYENRHDYVCVSPEEVEMS